MKAIKLMEKKKDMENAFSLKEAGMKDSGKMIKCTDMGNFTILMEVWHTKDNGSIASFMEMVKYIASNHSF